MMPYLHFHSLTKRYGAVTALAGVSLSVSKGTVLGLLGPNGAGKSTLFGCLLGLTRPTAGEITIQGSAIENGTRQRFGYTPERVALYPQDSVWENALFFARLRGHGPGELEHQLKRAGLYDVRQRKVSQLSKGMLQRLGLAIALCGQPELLVLDEPFNGLDPVVLETLRETLYQERARGATLLISTHTISAIEALATHIGILLEGRLVAHGTLEGLRRDHGESLCLESLYHRIARQQRRRAEAAVQEEVRA